MCGFLPAPVVNAQPRKSHKHFTNNPLHIQQESAYVLLLTFDTKVKQKTDCKFRISPGLVPMHGDVLFRLAKAIQQTVRVRFS
jgi:hypothetical protein